MTKAIEFVLFARTTPAISCKLPADSRLRVWRALAKCLNHRNLFHLRMLWHGVRCWEGMTAKKEMNSRQGFGFLGLGFFLWLVPAMAPNAFPAPSFGGMNGRAMWLEGMGVVQMFLGGGIVLRHLAWPALLRLATVSKPPQAVPAFAQPSARRSALRKAPVRTRLPAVLRSA
jgi:hypothetical protein